MSLERFPGLASMHAFLEAEIAADASWRLWCKGGIEGATSAAVKALDLYRGSSEARLIKKSLRKRVAEAVINQDGDALTMQFMAVVIRDPLNYPVAASAHQVFEVFGYPNEEQMRQYLLSVKEELAIRQTVSVNVDG